ncbi:MAG: PHP domain-containing protein [Lachnospiraceae bacterium]
MHQLYKKIEIDTHTHSVLSGHAWSTLQENCVAAHKYKLKGICLTEHGPSMNNSINSFATCSLDLIPNYISGVRVITGMEFNIISLNGDIDFIEPSSHKNIHFGIASMHDVTSPRGTPLQHTDAYISALHNPLIDILGHPGYSLFKNDPEPIVKAAYRLDKLIEINNNSFRTRRGSAETCMLFAKYCMKYSVKVCVSSDSHFSAMIGRVPMAMKMLSDLQFPEELILNSNYHNFIQYLSNHNRI